MHCRVRLLSFQISSERISSANKTTKVFSTNGNNKYIKFKKKILNLLTKKSAPFNSYYYYYPLSVIILQRNIIFKLSYVN